MFHAQQIIFCTYSTYRHGKQATYLAPHSLSDEHPSLGVTVFSLEPRRRNQWPLWP